MLSFWSYLEAEGYVANRPLARIQYAKLQYRKPIRLEQEKTSPVTSARWIIMKELDRSDLAYDPGLCPVQRDTHRADSSEDRAVQMKAEFSERIAPR